MATWYSSAGSDGTRHEYRQVKPHPYLNLPAATSSPSLVEIVNSGAEGSLPLTLRPLQTSPPIPTKLMPSEMADCPVLIIPALTFGV